MREPSLEAQIAGAQEYEDFLVPALLREWAPRVADAAEIRPGQRVLDIACGTGLLGREAASRVGPGGSVAGVDPNAGMLAVAARLAPAIEWRQATAEALPYPDQSFDAVVSQFGLMFFTDRHQALREMLRVLVPGGRLAVAVWDSLDHTPAYAAEVALLERLAGPRAAEALRAPFVLGDRGKLSELFAAAGVASVAITTLRGTARFPSIRSLLQADLLGWLPVMGVVLGDDLVDRILEEGEHALGAYADAAGKVTFDSPAHIVTGTKPQSEA